MRERIYRVENSFPSTIGQGWEVFPLNDYGHRIISMLDFDHDLDWSHRMVWREREREREREKDREREIQTDGQTDKQHDRRVGSRKTS